MASPSLLTAVLAFSMLGAACGQSGPGPGTSSPPPAESGTEGVVSRIALGSCAFQWVEQPIWNAVVAADPDLFLYLGDAIYGDFDGKSTFDVTPESLRAEWQKLAGHPDWQRLRANVPVMATWDNHDYGHYGAGTEFPLKAESQQIFLDFFGEPASSQRRSTPGVYTAETFGLPGQRVQIILLDTRYFKDPPVLAERPAGAGGSLGKFAPNEDPGATLLGQAQWNWLEEQLTRPAEIRLIASSGQIVADQKGMDEWGNYPLERRRLFDLIGSTGAEGVVLLSGNVHFAEVSETDEGPYPLTDFTASGLTHVNEEYPKFENRYRVAGPLVEVNFGLVEIDWGAEPSPTITLRAINVEREVSFEHTVRVADLS